MNDFFFQGEIRQYPSHFRQYPLQKGGAKRSSHGIVPDYNPDINRGCDPYMNRNYDPLRSIVNSDYNPDTNPNHRRKPAAKQTSYGIVPNYNPADKKTSYGNSGNIVPRDPRVPKISTSNFPYTK